MDNFVENENMYSLSVMASSGLQSHQNYSDMHCSKLLLQRFDETDLYTLYLTSWCCICIDEGGHSSIETRF